MIRPILIVTALFMSCGCQDLNERAAMLAARGGLKPQLVQGSGFEHEIFVRRAASGNSLVVFIEGDGSPWRAGGTKVAHDPTPHRPLALSLATQTPGSVLYLGRPCYFLARADARCAARLWTSARYSAEVVASMSSVITRVADEFNSPQVVLIGYSGGGTLAVLIAARLPATAAVISIGGNLDTAEWTRWHGYSTLVGSLNPSTQPPLDAKIKQWHLVGDQDSNVPAYLNARYWQRLAPDQIWHFADFDHVCCWAEQWPRLWDQILDKLDQASPSVK
jgi:hypothetical protein